MTNARGWRRRCANIVNDLDIPAPFDIDVLCRSVAESRGRDLVLWAMAMPAGEPSGLWLAAGDRDYIFYERLTSKLHQEHIKAHELGHVLAGHEPTEIHISDELGQQLPDLDPTVVRRLLMRSHSADAHFRPACEREAETIATLLLERANRWKPMPEWPTDPATAGIRQRIGQVFEPPPT